MGPLHVWYHLALFAILSILAMRSSGRGSIRFALLTAAALLGLGLEYMESLHYQFPIEVNDVVTDTCGVILGAFLGWLISLRKKPSA